MTHNSLQEKLSHRIPELEDAQEKLEARITALTQPAMETGTIEFTTLFDVEEIQRLQDQFADATGVASIITHPDGRPITRPSNFCRLCGIIRSTEEGSANCRKSDTIIGGFCGSSPTIQTCASGGLWDAGSPISIGGAHIASWIIGQIRDDTQSDDRIREYARKIGADETDMSEALREVPVMSRDQLEQVAQMLFTLANQLSTIAYHNHLQKQHISELKSAKSFLTQYRTHLTTLVKERTQDLSRRNKQLQNKIIERNNLQVKLFHAMDIARMAPWEYNFEKDRFTFNDQFYKLFRTTTEEVGKTTMSGAEYSERFIHPEDVPLIKKKFHAPPDINPRPYSTPFEHRIRYADGSTGHIVVRHLPVKNAKGKTVKIYGVNQDITEQKQAEAEREQLMSAVEQVGDMIAILDLEGRITYVNPAFEKATGYCREEILNRPPHFLEKSSGGEDFLRKSWDVISSGDTWSGNVVHKRADGTFFTTAATISPIRSTLNEIVNIIAVSRDITEQLRLEDQLRQAQKMESVGRLAGGIAHDYNNMLGVIIGHTELAINESPPDNPIRHHLEAILNASQRSSSITRQLLAFARKQTIRPKIIDLNRTVSHMMEMLKRLIGEQISLKWIPKTDLWPVKMDPSQIDQILANLCVNAKDAIGDMGKITIETDMKVFDEAYCSLHMGFLPGEYVVLVVSDDGCGMDREILDKAFEPFFTTKGPHEGTGLGLAMVYGIVKQNNGFINIYSEPGEGTTFKLYLPRQQGAPAKEAPKPTTELRQGNGETVLLVEDEEIIIEMVEKILEKLDYRVLTAETPLKALELAEMHTGEIDLLITDVVMPGMNGRDLVKQFKSTHPGINVLYMSGYTANVIVHQGVLDPGVHFLQKPFSIHDLAGKVREALEEETPEGE